MSPAVSRQARHAKKWIEFRNFDDAYSPKIVTHTGYDEMSPFAGVYTGYSRYIPGMLVGMNVVNGDTTYYPNYNWFVIDIDYSYDIHGNVDSMLNIGWQGSALAFFRANMFKTIAYHYDLICGKMNQGYADEFYHRYEYDTDASKRKRKSDHC